MRLKNWFNRRREKREKQGRFEDLSEEEVQDLHSTEKSAYLGVAKKQVTYRGKINAYKDFPIDNADRQEIDTEDGSVKELDNKEEEEDLDEANEEFNKPEEKIDEAPEMEIDNEITKREVDYNVYPAVQQMR